MNDVKPDAKAIFLEALDCKGADELMRFLEKACGSGAALRTRVEELLRAPPMLYRQLDWSAGRCGGWRIGIL